MTIEKIVPVSLDMFVQGAENRSARTNRQLAHLMGDYFGRGRLHLYRGIRSGCVLTLTEDTAIKINEYVFSQISETFDLPPRSDPQEFYVQQQKQARGVIGYVGNLLPEAAKDLELKDEIAYYSDRPSDVFELLSKPPDKIDPALAYELQRHLLLAHISGFINARTLNGRLTTSLAKIQKHFNQSLYEGLEGAGERFILGSIHDDVTNEVVDFPGENKRVPSTAHLKQVPFTVRRISGIGLVATSPRKKDDENAVIKALSEACDNGGIIDIKSIQDGMGMMYVLMNNNMPEEQQDEQLEYLVSRVVGELQSSPLKIKETRREDHVDANRGQSPDIKFKRLIVDFEGEFVPPLEMMFYNAKDYLNSRLEVGQRDPKTGLFMGQAYELYRLRRIYPVLSILFPSAIYDRDPVRRLDLHRIVVKRSYTMAQELRGSYREAA